MHVYGHSPLLREMGDRSVSRPMKQTRAQLSSVFYPSRHHKRLVLVAPEGRGGRGSPYKCNQVLQFGPKLRSTKQTQSWKLREERYDCLVLVPVYRACTGTQKVRLFTSRASWRWLVLLEVLSSGAKQMSAARLGGRSWRTAEKAHLLSVHFRLFANSTTLAGKLD